MVNVITTIIINSPIDHVKLFSCDPDNAPKWYVNIKSVSWKTPRPMQVGSQIDFVAHFMGKKLSYTYVVISITKDKFTMQTAQGPFPMTTTYRFEKMSDQKTKMTLQNTGKPSGFSILLMPFMNLMIRKANKKDLAKLKQLLEEVT